MKLIENKNGLRILEPESPEYILYSVDRNTYHEKVILGKHDSIENYKEMERALLEKVEENNAVQNLLNRIEEQDSLISKLAEQLSELAKLINKK